MAAAASPGPSTTSVHGGRQPNPYRAVTEPVVTSAPTVFRNTADLVAFVEARQQGQTEVVEYGRYGNPTVRDAERRLAALEGAEDALLLASGMAAVTTTLLTLVPAGRHVVLTDGVYRRTRQFATDFLPHLGISVSVWDWHTPLAEVFRPETALVLAETPTNPYLRVLDLEALARTAHAYGALAVVDATFATPINLKPLALGVDLVVHSATKYLGGHHDLLAGVVAGASALVEQVRAALGVLGGVCAPQTAAALARGLRTLGLRMAQHNRNGQAVAEFLEGHPAVERVWYPGLSSHPDHAVARRQMRGFGGVVSFTVKGGLEETARFVDALRIPLLAASLGGVESLVTLPALASYYNLSPEERQALGIPDNLVRLSLGVEDTADLLDDLAQALAAV
ncbi:MAG TPA: aminotransferase class I/II-fold pyridoxal phosphate-dependent enzyme [Chloroflexi bacterium]|nr:aminotransferase class I/II-fold pyridoxal phosphate-dependent enzyme [Chloroflexota bacterium]